MFAFIFDLVLFFVAKARINAVGSAQIGNAIWLTLAAWLLLFFSGCFYSLGRCCISNRPRAPGGGKYSGNYGRKDPEAIPGPNKDYAAEQLRLDAVKSEADRKARQKVPEVGLPAFGSETQPLTGRIEGDHVYFDGEDGGSQTSLPANVSPPIRTHAPGYVQGTPGTRAMDDYYNPRPLSPQTTGTTYPPQNPHRQPSGYAPSTYSANVPHSPPPQHTAGYGAYNAPLTTSPPPSNQLLAIPGQYGHTAGGTSCKPLITGYVQGHGLILPFFIDHTAASYHEQQPSSYSQYDPYAPQSHYAEPSYNGDPYNNPATGYAATHDPYYHSTPSPPPQQNQRQYTLGGDGYGASSVPPLQQDYVNHPTGYGASSVPPLQDYHDSHSGQYGIQAPPGINTNVGYAYSPQTSTSPVRGPRAQPGTTPEAPPPSYEPSPSGITGNWDKR